MSAATSRVGGYLASCIARAGGTELQQNVARVVGYLLAGEQYQGAVSARAIGEACVDGGAGSTAWYGFVHAPSYGTVTGVLEVLRAIGCVTWERGWSTTWTPESEIPEGAKRPVQHADGSWRFAARDLSLVGWVATLVRGGVASVAALIASDARAPLACGARPARLDPPPDSKSEQESPRPVSIESAPSAEPAAPDSPPGEESYFDRVARKYLDAQRTR